MASAIFIAASSSTTKYRKSNLVPVNHGAKIRIHFFSLRLERSALYNPHFCIYWQPIGEIILLHYHHTSELRGLCLTELAAVKTPKNWHWFFGIRKTKFFWTKLSGGLFIFQYYGKFCSTQHKCPFFQKHYIFIHQKYLHFFP